MSISRQIIITGISSELGNTLAKELAVDKKVKIIGTMRRSKVTSDNFSENIQILDACDLTKPDCCQQLADLAKERFSGPFGLIHCAGDFWDHVPFLDFGPDQAKRMFASHVTTLYNVLQSIIPIMLSHKGGGCIAFSCNSTLYNYPWMTAFTASKSAVDSMACSLANEYSGSNIRFNTLRLSSLKTTPVMESKPNGDFEHYTPPKDIAPIVRFLLSDEAYLINGNSITVFKHSDRFFHQGYFERVSK